MDDIENPYFDTAELLEWLANQDSKLTDRTAALQAIANLAATDKVAVLARHPLTDQLVMMPAIEWVYLSIVWDKLYRTWVAVKSDEVDKFEERSSPFQPRTAEARIMYQGEGPPTASRPSCWRDLRFQRASIKQLLAKAVPAKTTSAAENECKIWLTNLMAETEKTKTKPDCQSALNLDPRSACNVDPCWDARWRSSR